MVTSDQTQILAEMKALFPEFGQKLEFLYREDPVFREIAMEYHECTRRKEAIFQETGRVSEIYTETMRELKEELLSHLTEEMQT